MFRRLLLGVAVLCGAVLFVPSAHGEDFWSLFADWLKDVKVGGKGFPQVSRIQFRVQTSRVNGADTDAWISIALNDKVCTFLDLPGDDFERGKNQTFDLMLSDNDFGNIIRKLEDIQFLKINCHGKANDWAIDSFALLVNGQVVYQERFARPKWLGSHTVAKEALHGSLDWQKWKWEMPSLRYSREELEQRIASCVGHFMHESPHLKGIKWGKNGRGVRLSHRAADTLHLHLDLQKDVRRLPNPDFDIDLGVQFHQMEDRLEIKIVDAQLKGDGNVAKIGAVVAPKAVKEARDAVRKMLTNRELVSVPFPKGVEFYVRVHTNGDLELKLGKDPLVGR